MSVKRDDTRGKTPPLCFLQQMADNELVTTVHTIEHSYGSYARKSL
jgi:hypothetical protein